jgi:hypothetical protein
MKLIRAAIDKGDTQAGGVARRDAIYRKALAMGDGPDVVGPAWQAEGGGGEGCNLGVGCDEAGVCYAMAHGQPDRCGAEGGKSAGEFEEWLNDHRESDVSSVFHEIIAKFKSAARAAIDKGGKSAQPIYQVRTDKMTPDYWKDCEKHTFDSCTDDIYERRISYSAPQAEGGKSEAVYQWISVEDRLPNFPTTVLVAYESDSDGEPCLDTGEAILHPDGNGMAWACSTRLAESLAMRRA